MEQDFDIKHWTNACPKYDCHKDNCKCGLKSVSLPAILGDDSKDSPIAPKNGAYCNAVVKYEANGHIYIYSKEGIPTLIETDGGNTEGLIKKIEEDLAQEVLDREAADNTLQEEIDDIKNSPDVVDIVATYAALQAYDTQHLGDNDVIRVLQDETHEGQSTYYRWNKTAGTWSYIGSVGDYYTKGQVDALLDDKQDVLTAGANITIDANNEISAIDTTYSDFTGTDGVYAGEAGLVPAPAAADAGKFLKADGTWDTAGSNINVVQTAGVSETSVMSQKAASNLIYRTIGASALNGIRIISSSDADNFLTNPGVKGVIIGPGAKAYNANYDVVIGGEARGGDDNGVPGYSISLGAYANATQKGQFDVSTGSQPTAGYNNTNYRLLTGLHDPVNAHDAATKGYVDSQGGGPTVVQTTGTSTTDVMSQNAVTSMVFADPSTKLNVSIGNSNAGPSSVSVGASAYGAGPTSVAVGTSANTYGGSNAVALGFYARARRNGAVAIGYNTNNGQDGNTGSIALGAYSSAPNVGEMNIGSSQTSYGYNNTNYRLLSGVYDGQGAHDAVTVGQVNATIDAINTALNTNIPHIGA